MKSRNLPTVVALTLFAALAITSQLFGQATSSHSHKHHQYKLIDLGTVGGPNSNFPSGPPQFRFLNNRDTVAGVSATSVADPYYPYCLADCYLDHTFRWRDGVLTDMGALPGNNGSLPFGINDWGTIIGVSENGSYDPTTGYPIYRGVIWSGGRITDIGTLGGNNAEPNGINDWGQVVGGAQNNIPDAYASGLGPCFNVDCWPSATQIHAFRWQYGSMRDLGTLGGNDSAATLVNDLGEIAGVSYTNNTPNATTGLPTQDPFFWSGGRMVDIGTLGGTFGNPWWMNQVGQVVGQSNLAGDQLFHGFLWDRGRLNDLPPVGGGSISTALWVNDEGDAVGGSSIAGDQLFHAPLWTRGRAVDLGTVGQDACSQAYAINSSQQIVGVSGGMGQCSSFQTGRAFLWENGGPMVDLNALVDNPSDLHVYLGINITNDGNIAAQAILPNGDLHAVLLMPSGDCDVLCQHRIVESETLAVGPPVTSGATGPAFGRPSNWLLNAFGRRSTKALQPFAPSK